MKGILSLNKAVRALQSLMLILILTCLDQAAKIVAERLLSNSISVGLIPGVLEFTYVQNRGIAFGLMQGRLAGVLLFTLFFVLVSAYVIWKLPEGAYYFPLWLVLIFLDAGAVGNFADRVIRGYVVDFIYFSLIDFPVFNIADIYVVLAGCFLILLLFTRYKDDEFAFLKLHR